MMSFADEPRKVLLFYKTEGEKQLQSQTQLLASAQKGILERDIQIEKIPYSAGNAGKWKQWKIKDSDAFTFILVGRDGGEKLRSQEAVKAEELFGLIDAMPMRKREIKENR